MRDQQKHLPVNWVDGMKISKHHFIAQDNAWQAALQDNAGLQVSPLRYGVLPAAANGEETFDIRMALDNQGSLRVTVLSCQAVTPGGARVRLPAQSLPGQVAAEGMPTTSFQFTPSASENTYWIVLTVNPFDRQPAGSPDLTETPPRLPGVVPSYGVQVVSDSQYRQFASHPYGLIIGKVAVNGADIRVEEDYIPPCYSVSAYPDLLALHGELDQFLSSLELRASQIVQKIYKKSQQNELSELVLFLCDRVMLYLGPAITTHRWIAVHEPPAVLFASIVSLARVMKNTIDLRTGTGRDELMNYFSEWTDLKQGEFVNMLTDLSALRYDHNDINQHLIRIIRFVKVTGKLFETLSNLEFIGKRKETGIFVKEEFNAQPDSQQAKQKRRFFG